MARFDFPLLASSDGLYSRKGRGTDLKRGSNGLGVHGGRLGSGGFQGFLANIRYRLWTAAAKDDDW